MDKLIIDYEFGYHNWYVSEFYKFFHKRLSETTNINLEYMSLNELAQKFGKNIDNHSNSIFNWFNLVLYNEKTEKFFIHSWYDYAPEVLKYAVENDFNVVKFSCVSNLSEKIIDYFKDTTIVQPSVYYVENWRDIEFILTTPEKSIRDKRAYFNGLNHGIRENILGALSQNEFFNLRTKVNPEHFRQKNDYYEEVSRHKFGLSLNGAANICYRDLELFGLGVLNLRQPLKSLTHEPLIKDVHYVEFIEDSLVQRILQREDVTNTINEKVEQILDFCDTQEYNEMILQSKNWFGRNCLPENQFNTIVSFLDDFNIFL
jgi:hypothetical protein